MVVIQRPDIEKLRDEIRIHDRKYYVEANPELTDLQYDQLRNDMSIYIVGSGRINVAGISEANVDRLCEGIKRVIA
ncbi:hypothetical protein AB1L30_00045 [Bremerella sp. JC817]|uniref:hypothetical protein n=1 Tax=Bremerella sp. JC817 TaxID=3231756 RepID=UPI003457C71B